MKLFVDDLRTPPTDEGDWIVAKSSEQAINFLTIASKVKSGEVPLFDDQSYDFWMNFEAISLDHDLGGDDNTRKVVDWMAEHDFWPDEVLIHTQNPVGRKALLATVNRYAPPDTEVWERFL